MRRILIVEDLEAYQKLLYRTLTRAFPDATIETVGSLEAAKHRLGLGSVDVIVLDLTLPDSGREETLGEMLMASRAPVVVASGAMTVYDVQKAREDGARIAVSKDEFLRRIQENDQELIDVLSGEFDPDILLHGARKGGH